MIQAYRQVTDHFRYDKCECPCCGKLLLVPQFFRHMERLEQMRQALDFRMVITSGCRCEEHNKTVGGAPIQYDEDGYRVKHSGSQHLIYATDVRPEWPDGKHGDDEFLRRLQAMYDECLSIGFTGLKKYSTWIHCDLREGIKWIVPV